MTLPSSSRQGVPTLVLVDGTALAYRSYYAFIRSPLVNSRGENVSAVYGFASSLIKLLEEREPDYVAVVFDTPEPTFRHEAYEAYKATREEAPDEMVAQLPVIHELVEELGIAVLELPGYEADDVIGTLARRASERGIRVVIVSGDKDFFQLVADDVTVYDPGKGVEYTPEVVEERFGVPPRAVTDVLGLMGDSSDNVPGVPGIGKKTATELVARYGTIEEVLGHINEISGTKRRERLSEHGRTALASRDLVTIDVDAPVELDLARLRRRPPDPFELARLLKDLEFPSLIERVLPLGGGGVATYEVVASEKGLATLVRRLTESGGFVIDLETTSLDPITTEIVGISVAFEEGTAYYVPVGHASGKCLPRDAVLEKLRPVLENSAVPKYGQNMKFDYAVLKAHGIELGPLSFDTMVASYLLDPGRRQHGLAVLALEHLSRRVTTIEELIGRGKDRLTFDQVPIEAASDYACEDAEVTLLLKNVLEPALEEAELSGLMHDIEMPLVPVLARMELRGVGLDTDVLGELAAKLGKEAERLRRRVVELAGKEFNLDSPKQVGEILFDHLGLPRGRRTKTGYSTDVTVLERLSGEHEVPKLILSYRQLMKLKSGYLDALPKLVNPRTGRVHTSFNQTVAATGRLSSSNPNLQNIPIRNELGREIRRAFVAEEGRVLLSADYSQIELRIMAHLSGDEGLIKAFRAGKDFHRATAALIFEKGEGEVTEAERDWAKMVNFGIMYGMSPYGLARALAVTTEEAAEFIERYFDAHPGVREYTARVVDEARRTGYARTMLGRRRPVGGLDSDDRNVRRAAERVAVNTPIQGSAADLIKVAMIGVDRRLASEKVPCDMVLQVHDELVFEVDEGALERALPLIRDEMEHPCGFDLEVPIVVNFGHGPSWYDAH